MKSTANQLQALQDAIHEVPKTYVTKLEYVHDRDRILDGLENLGNKIEQSAVNIEADYNRRMDKLEAIIIDKGSRDG